MDRTHSLGRACLHAVGGTREHRSRETIHLRSCRRATRVSQPGPRVARSMPGWSGC